MRAGEMTMQQEQAAAIEGVLAGYELNRNSLTAGRVIGMGQFGAVHLALHTLADGSTATRAVKLLRNASSSADNKVSKNKKRIKEKIVRIYSRKMREPAVCCCP